MKYKILTNGRNSALVVDFIQHTSAYFTTLSTSECREDVLEHFKLLKPDAFVCFTELDYEKVISMINNLKNSGCYNGAAIILIGDDDTCNLIEEKSRSSADLIIRRPVTPDNLMLRITRYFDDLNAAKELARQKAQERKWSADSREKYDDMSLKDFPSTDESVQQSSDVLTKKHILIVDDDRTVLKMLKTALSEKYEVTTMINGVMIDKLLEVKKVDLIILDYEMPIETGADIFVRLKANPKAAHIPVCFLTGVSDREKIMKVMALKPHGYLLKPIDMDMLSATVSNLTD